MPLSAALFDSHGSSALFVFAVLCVCLCGAKDRIREKGVRAEGEYLVCGIYKQNMYHARGMINQTYLSPTDGFKIFHGKART